MKYSIARSTLAVALFFPLSMLFCVRVNDSERPFDTRIRGSARAESDDVFCAAPTTGAPNSPSRLARTGRSGPALPAGLAVTRSASVAREQAPDTIFADFNQWIEEYVRRTESGDTDEAMATRGESLARIRRQVLARLIESDPERALSLAVPVSVGRCLPPVIARHLEERLSGWARYEVIAVLANSVEPQTRPTIERRVTLKDKTYRAFVYGRRLQVTTKDAIRIHGIAVADALAVHESPVRVLDPGEAPDATSGGGNSQAFCPISKRVTAPEIAVEAGGEVFHLCQTGHVAAFRQRLEQEEMTIGPAINNWASGTPGGGWTKGPKKVLFMRVVCPDATEESISEAEADELMRKVNEFFVLNSYGATSLAATVTPLLLLPNSARWYETNYAADALLVDSRQAAVSAGFDPADFDLDCVHFRISGLRNQAYVGARGAWLQTTNVGAVCHEFGHNYGLWHANAWVTSDGSVTGDGQNQEYGNVFDTMGGGSVLPYQFNACHKRLLDWLPDSAVQTITEDGVYRLYPFDIAALTEGRSYALRIRMDGRRDYWIETRGQLTAQHWPGPSVLVNWSPWTGSNWGSQLLDMTPGSEGGLYDAQLLLGRSFFDPTLGLKITLRRLGGTTPESIDVEVTHVLSFSLNLKHEPDGNMTITLNDGAAGNYVVEATTDFAAWVIVGRFPTPTGTGQVTDYSARYFPWRFYRARPEPTVPVVNAGVASYE